MRYPPFWADVGSMPIKLRAVRIRIFCAPRASGTGIAGRPKTFYRPNVRIMLAEGTVEVTGRCPRMDRYGHDSEKGAMACFRHLANERGATIP
jgi:hypothetical protein